MADFDNLAEINENFDTIKTLLNSIRAQGILNTSDVDKLLSGINAKLEKLNTEEDIDLIKIFLSELKQNFEERHGMLVSKFAAIESLFANLLKNSSEMLKSSEVKELFDIVATNLSVFSREVVSQKESLTDISLRLDALRSDDSQKKDIIKNITLLKSDIERLNNGFDSIVISLNDNFKTVVKTISTLDKTEYLDKFSDALANIETSSNTVLSAIQMLDKKTEQVEIALKDVATKDDISGAAQKIFELTAQSHELTAAVSDLNNKYIKFETLAEKIDATVNIIATLKSNLEETDDSNTQKVLSEISTIQEALVKVSSEAEFEALKGELATIFKFMQERFESVGNRSVLVFEEVQKLASLLQALDIKEGLSALEALIKSSIEDATSQVDSKIQNLTVLNDAGVARVINEISTEASSLTARLTQAQSEIGILCEKNFSSVFEKVVDLKALLAQIDENNVSANNAIFSSITDRLSIFETGLRESLEAQEKTVSHSSAQLVEQIENIKNLSNVLDYKLDASVVESANVKREFVDLKTSVENVLALDFTNVVKDLRIDLYAIKQDLSNSYENSSSELTERFTSDLYGKYELLVSKIDSVEEELRKSQASSLVELKRVLDGISSSLVDVISYVSERKANSTDSDNVKFDEIINLITDNNINYVENVRDIVEVIRTQVESNIKSIEEETLNNFDKINKALADNSEIIQKEIKCSYAKLIEVQDSYKELQELLNVTKELENSKFNEVLTNASTIKSDLESKIDLFKKTLLDSISEFKTEFTCENADKISEIKFSVDSLYNKNAQEINSLVVEMRDSISKLSSDNINGRIAALSKIEDSFSSIKDLLYNLQDKNVEVLAEKVESILADFKEVKSAVAQLDAAVDGDMSRQLSIIEGNFESLVSQLTILFDKSEISLSNKVNDEFAKISEIMQDSIEQKLESYKGKIDLLILELKEKNTEQSDYIQERIANLNTTLKDIWAEQAQDNAGQISKLTNELREILDGSVELTKETLSDVRSDLESLAISIVDSNKTISETLNNQLEDVAKYTNTILDTLAQENEERQTELITSLDNVSENVAKNANTVIESLTQVSSENKSVLINSLNDISEKVASSADIVDKGISGVNGKLEALSADIKNNDEMLKALNKELVDNIADVKTYVEVSVKEELIAIDAYVNNLLKQLEIQKENVLSCKELLSNVLDVDLKSISTNIEKETDIIVGELIEQFDLLKKSQSDDISRVLSSVEDIVNTQIYNNIEDLKSYFDIKTDNSVLNAKFDNLKIELVANADSVIEGMSKLLDCGTFASSISDFKLANELLLNNAVDSLNGKLEAFIKANFAEQLEKLEANNKKVQDRLSVLDDNFVNSLVEKFEEIKLISNSFDESYVNLQQSVSKIFTEFEFVKQNVVKEISSLSELVKKSASSTNTAIGKINDSLLALKEQVLDRDFETSFQISLNKQISDIENLISTQIGHIEDIEEICAMNLPDVAEMNTLVKHSLVNSLEQLHSKFENIDFAEQFENELKQTKSDIITQFLNIFNQISFVVEQEEIIDFIQEKHDELITVLSHIVTTAGDIDEIKDNVSLVDSKIDNLKEDIDLINEKITAIISADGDIDYVYSLQDLEADIANLRLVLNEMKDSGNNFADLISSTEDIYQLVESFKAELPTKQDLDNMAEDIVSISTRTNKLILASDESYKNLQDNLQDFKLVINDLDERTRNFARESGLDRIDGKLNALNNMVQNGAKTNQVFNQVFEYLAEWVDNASVQINSISDKVETLDDIGQIKAMLLDLKEGAADNSETVELIEALGAVFDKQTKRIAALETKLDKIIVETTISNKNNKLDLTPFESTLNSFLVAIDEKMSGQQKKIDSLETKLENIVNAVCEKDTQQLTKKVGGMDRQIAKLNKSIEKIASYVVER